jgi:glycosyltransferase involved in cell wall biosynthesis
MRVGFDARWYNDSGVGKYVAELVPALVRAGCELVVYVDPGNPAPGLENFSAKVVPVRSGKYSLSSQFELRHRAKQDKLDLFHSPFYMPPLALPCPLIITIHDLIPFLFTVYPFYRWPKQQMVRAGYRAAVKRAAHVIVDSQQTSDDLQKILSVQAKQITPIHLAAGKAFRSVSTAGELQCLQKKFLLQAPYIVVASSNNWKTKNLEGALTALEIARKSMGVEFQTLIYGPPEGFHAAGGKKRWPTLDIHYAGYLEMRELAAIFRHAHAFVMPSLYEGFGLPLVEAMSCGCPVITSNRGALPEIAGNGAQCFDPFDIPKMVNAVVELVRSPSELERRRSAALQRSVDFSWDKAAFETFWVYHHVHHQISVK